MRKYNKNKPLIFIHIPKCGGRSIEAILKIWFGENFFRHGFNKISCCFRSIPYDTRPGMCISGHFTMRGNKGVQDLYPEVDQFITFVREPFEIAVSQYFYWKKKRRKMLIDQGILKEDSEDDYKNINDFFKKRGKSVFLNFMPCRLTIDNYQEVFNKYYIYMGITEDLQTSINLLAEKLDFPRQEISHLNISDRDEVITEELRNDFVNNNLFEYHIYDYILSKYKDID